MPYLLDANVFIQAKNLHYGLDFCPAFWDWLVDANARGLVYSIEKVGDELDAGADELTTWATARKPGFFLKPDTAMLTALAPLSEWVTGQGYDPAAVSTFLQVGATARGSSPQPRGSVVGAPAFANRSLRSQLRLDGPAPRLEACAVARDDEVVMAVTGRVTDRTPYDAAHVAPAERYRQHTHETLARSSRAPFDVPRTGAGQGA